MDLCRKRKIYFFLQNIFEIKQASRKGPKGTCLSGLFVRVGSLCEAGMSHEVFEIRKKKVSFLLLPLQLLLLLYNTIILRRIFIY